MSFSIRFFVSFASECVRRPRLRHRISAVNPIVRSISMVALPRLATGLALVWVGAASPVLAVGYGGTVADMLVRGDSLLAQQRPNEAIVQYQEARTLCPTPFESVSSYMGEARARVELGQLLPAAGLLEEAADLYAGDPRAAELLYQAGNARFEAGEMEGAIDNLRQALESSPSLDLVPGLKFQLARSLRRNGQADETAALLEECETEFAGSPMLPTIMYTRAIALHDLGELATSEEVYRKIVERFPNTQAAREAHYELGEVLSARGNRTEAVEFYRRFAAGNPSSPMAAKALERAGDLMLFRSPRTSAQLYGLAMIKANTNPTPPVPTLAVSTWLTTKKKLAETLSRSWVLAILAIGMVVGVAAVVLIGRRVIQRWRSPHQVGA